MTKDNEDALRCADALDDEFTKGRISNHNGRKAAAHLRRLVRENEAKDALLRQAAEALQYFDDYIQPLTVKFGGPKVPEPASTAWHVNAAIAAIRQHLDQKTT